MIFVTVGTHEQPFLRLVEYMDKWAELHDEEVIIQSGYTEYVAKKAQMRAFLTRDEMLEHIAKARIVISHGGPACYIEILRCGKIPVVVPRNHKYGEQFDDHQIEIGREYASRYNAILLVENVEELSDYIDSYDARTKDMDASSVKSNNAGFCAGLSTAVDMLLCDRERRSLLRAGRGKNAKPIDRHSYL